MRNDDAHRTANRWHGGGAAALGLPERVSRRRFVQILEGRVPGTDIRLGRVVDGEHQHRPGWDPKLMSMIAPEMLTVIGIRVGLATLILVTSARTDRRIDDHMTRTDKKFDAYLAEAAADRRALKASMDNFRREMRRLAERQAHVERHRTATAAPAE